MFYFDVDDDEITTRDDTGIELPCWEAARAEAVSTLSDIARDLLPQGGDRRAIVRDVRDVSGRVVFTAQVSFTARWVGQGPSSL